MDPLRRITDLFVEGKEVVCGTDADGNPALVWVNKLNSFEVDECRSDGLAARGLRVQALSKPDNPELMSLMVVMGEWDADELAKRHVEARETEMSMQALSNIESDEKWREKLVTLRRMPTLLADADAPEDDERRKQLDELSSEYLEALRTEREKVRKGFLVDAKAMGEAKLREDYVEQWRFQVTSTDFMNARRATELFFALRECRGTAKGEHWDHTDCNHRQLLLNERSEVKGLPDRLLEMVAEALDEVTTPGRESGNSDVPASSSASSEQPSVPEESTPSSPEETPVVALTT